MQTIRAPLRYMAVQCLYNLAIYYGYYWLDAIATATMMPIHPNAHTSLWCGVIYRLYYMPAI